MFDLFGSGSIFLTQNFATQDLNRDGAVDDLDIPVAAVVANSAPPGVLPTAPDDRNSYFGYYLQDDWKITSKLTINAGVRWGFMTNPTDRLNRINVIPDFAKGLGEFAEGVLSISPSNYDLAPALTDPFRKRFGYFMVHEAIEHAVALDVLVQAIERAKSAKPKAVTEALHGVRFEGGWTKAMPGGAVRFDQTGLNTLSVPIMVQWRNKELVTVWPKDFAKASPVWHSQ